VIVSEEKSSLDVRVSVCVCSRGGVCTCAPCLAFISFSFVSVQEELIREDERSLRQRCPGSSRSEG